MGPRPPLSGSRRGPGDPSATPLQLRLHFKINIFFAGGWCHLLPGPAKPGSEQRGRQLGHVEPHDLLHHGETVGGRSTSLSHNGAWWGLSSPAWGGKRLALRSPGKAPTIPPRGLRWEGEQGWAGWDSAGLGELPGRGTGPLRAPPAPSQVPAPLVPPAAAGPRCIPSSPLVTAGWPCACAQRSQLRSMASPAGARGGAGWRAHCSSSQEGFSAPGVFSLMLNCLRVCSNCCWFPAK